MYSVGNPPRQLMLHWDRREAHAEILTPKTAVTTDRLFGVVLLEHVLAQSNTFAYRFNRLSIVPISDVSLDWKDRTGVNDVHFAAGSKQEQFWLAQAAANMGLHSFPGARLQAMFQMGWIDTQQEQSPPITVDISCLDEGELIVMSGAKRQRPIPRIRRDLFAQHLDEAGCYVEQQGNTLIIKPHPHFHLAPIARRP